MVEIIVQEKQTETVQTYHTFPLSFTYLLISQSYKLTLRFNNS